MWVRVLYLTVLDRGQIEVGSVYKVTKTDGNDVMVALSRDRGEFVLFKDQFEFLPYYNSSLMKALRDEV